MIASDQDVTFSEHSSFGKLLMFAEESSLMRLGINELFVRALFDKEPDNTDSYHSLIDVVTDMCHDFF